MLLCFAWVTLKVKCFDGIDGKAGGGGGEGGKLLSRTDKTGDNGVTTSSIWWHTDVKHELEFVQSQVFARLESYFWLIWSWSL